MIDGIDLEGAERKSTIGKFSVDYGYTTGSDHVPTTQFTEMVEYALEVAPSLKKGKAERLAFERWVNSPNFKVFMENEGFHEYDGEWYPNGSLVPVHIEYETIEFIASGGAITLTRNLATLGIKKNKNLVLKALKLKTTKPIEFGDKIVRKDVSSDLVVLGRLRTPIGDFENPVNILAQNSDVKGIRVLTQPAKGMTPDEYWERVNKPFIDNAIKDKAIFRFINDPRNPANQTTKFLNEKIPTYLHREYEYLKNHYKYKLNEDGYMIPSSRVNPKK